jgi:RNA polymerase sigma-70 factor (ECF subfamily)
MAEPPPDPLLAGLADGGEAALAALFAREAGGLFRVAVALLGCRADAEDAVQEVFVGLAQARTSWASVGNLRAYLFAALRHAAAKIRSRRERRSLPLPKAIAAPAAPALPARQAARLERALADLPVDRREVIVMKIDGELTFREIAAVLGISPNTAASRYRYALAELRERLEEDADD